MTKKLLIVLFTVFLIPAGWAADNADYAQAIKNFRD
jgi:hypothetical protein